MARRGSRGLRAVDRIKRLLGPVLRADSRAAKPVAEILELLPVVEEELRKVSPQPQRQYRTAKKYVIEESNEGGRLIEYRTGHKRPLACPYRVYRETAAALASAKAPLDFVEMVEEVRKRMGVRPGLSALRVLGRFWMATKPPLLSRIRARYLAVKPSTFEADAKRAWEDLSSSRGA